MTSALDREFNNLLNPAFGAILLRAFIDGFCESDPKQVPLHYLFLPIPLVSLEEFADALVSTNKSSGFRKVVSKVDSDLLYAIHYRVMDFRTLSLDAIKLGVSSKIILLDLETGNSLRPSKSLPSQILPISQKGILDASRKLGSWFSEMSTHEICTTLRVNL